MSTAVQRISPVPCQGEVLAAEDSPLAARGQAREIPPWCVACRGGPQHRVKCQRGYLSLVRGYVTIPLRYVDAPRRIL